MDLHLVIRIPAVGGYCDDLDGDNNDIECILNTPAPRPHRNTIPTLKVERLSVCRQGQHADDGENEVDQRPVLKQDPFTGKTIKYFPYRSPSKERERPRLQHTQGTIIVGIKS